MSWNSLVAKRSPITLVLRSDGDTFAAAHCGFFRTRICTNWVATLHNVLVYMQGALRACIAWSREIECCLVETRARG